MGLDGTGIEINSKMVEYCNDLEFDFLEGDAISSMANFEDQTFSIISIFHVVEHLNSDCLDELLSEFKSLMSTEGLLIIDTPSIDNLIVLTNNFYLENTHITHINAN